MVEQMIDSYSTEVHMKKVDRWVGIHKSSEHLSILPMSLKAWCRTFFELV